MSYLIPALKIIINVEFDFCDQKNNQQQNSLLSSIFTEM